VAFKKKGVKFIEFHCFDRFNRVAEFKRELLCNSIVFELSLLGS